MHFFFFYYISPKAKKEEKNHFLSFGFYVKFCAQKIPTHFFFFYIGQKNHSLIIMFSC